MSCNLLELMCAVGNSIAVGKIDPYRQRQSVARSDGGGRKAIGCYIVEFCRDRESNCRFQDVDGERRNVLAWIPGSSDEN